MTAPSARGSRRHLRLLEAGAKARNGFADEGPREKLFAKGAAALTDEELLAILLGTGTAGRHVMDLARDLLSGAGLFPFFGRGPESLRSLVTGVGTAKAARLAAVAEIARRLTEGDLASRDLIDDPTAAAKHLMALLAAETRELMGGLLLDAKHHLLRNSVVFRGTLTFAAVAPSPLFREAILCGAGGIILYHNHPSGDPKPSPEDLATTRRFVAAGAEIGIPIRDHIIVSRKGWLSFRAAGLLGP